jgi:hypothetical protein
MDPQFSETIHPAYIEIIKQLSPDEALILQHFRASEDYPYAFFPDLRRGPITDEEYFADFLKGIPIKNVAYSAAYIDNLSRLQLWEYSEVSFPPHGRAVKVTALGKAFMDVCFSAPPVKEA